MKQIAALVFSFALFFSPVAYATLFDRGGGLIYDSELDITWLQDANYAYTSGYWNTIDQNPGPDLGAMNWDDAMTWDGNLEYYDPIRGITWTNWRLPSNLPVAGNDYNYNWSNDGSTDFSLNISLPGSAYPFTTVSEMAYMYYINLGNLGFYDVNGNFEPNHGLLNTGPFIDLKPFDYWSSSEYLPIGAWVFDFSHGDQEATGKEFNGVHVYS